MLDLQKCHLAIKRRLYPSLFVLKNCKRLHTSSLELTFNQIRIDYVDKNTLRDSVAADDVVHFGALLLKVRLHTDILRGKNLRVLSNLILKNIEWAIPSSFIDTEYQENGVISSRAAPA